MISSFYKCFGCSSTEPSETLETRMGEFYEAEKKALDPKAVRDSYALVGLHPWDKNLILKNCQENSPVAPHSSENSMISELAEKISMYSEMKRSEVDRIRSSVKRPEVATPGKTQKRERSEEECKKRQVQEGEGGPYSSYQKSMPITTQSPAKRAKSMHMEIKTCAAKGCQNTHYWSKKWVFCQNCNKNFCEEHKHELHYHHC